MTSTEINPVLNAVGERLRGLRRTRAMTLADVATVTGLSQSTLSRVESGGRRPSLEILLLLARTYGLTLDDLVGAPATGDPRVHPRPTTRYGATWLPLSQRPGGIQAYKLIVPGGFRASETDQRSHEGYEWIYVLSGSLRLLLGEHDILLTPGEAAEFDTHTPHGFSNPRPSPTELLMLVGPQGERAHVRARPSRTKGD